MICLLDEQQIGDRQGRDHAAGGPAGQLVAGSNAAALRHGAISERHRHRYEFNNVYRQQFEAGGMRMVGHQPRRHAGRDRRDCRASLVRGRAVPSRVQVAADAAAPLVRRLRRRGGRARVAARVKRRRRKTTRVGKLDLEPEKQDGTTPAMLIPTRVEDRTPWPTEGESDGKEDHRRRRLEEPGRGGAGGRAAAGATAAGRAEPQEPLPGQPHLLANSLYLQAAIALGLLPNPISEKSKLHLPQASTPSTRWRSSSRRPGEPHARGNRDRGDAAPVAAGVPLRGAAGEGKDGIGDWNSPRPRAAARGDGQAENRLASGLPAVRVTGFENLSRKGKNAKSRRRQRIRDQSRLVSSRAMATCSAPTGSRNGGTWGRYRNSTETSSCVHRRQRE